MSTLLLITLMAGVVFLCRLSGFVLPIQRTSSFWSQFLRFVPLSLFTALVVSALYKDTQDLNFKLAALLIAGLMVWRTQRFGLSIVTGLSILWLLMWLHS